MITSSPFIIISISSDEVKMRKLIGSKIAEHIVLADALGKGKIPEQIESIAKKIRAALKNGNKILFCGNGGSAADSQHLAAEFVGRFQKERNGLPAIALTVDTSILTAVGNDYGFEKVFARQVDALGNKGDVLIGFSTSGNSKNVLLAVALAKEKGLFTVGFTSNSGGQMAKECDINVNVPTKVTARAQEMHILLGHILCELVDGE